MSYLSIFVLNGLLAFQFFVLICAIMLWVYVSKNNAGKWLRYLAASIAVIVSLLIVCTLINAFIHACGHHGYGKGGYKGMRGCGHGMMMHGCCMHGMKGDMHGKKMCPHMEKDNDKEEMHEHEEGEMMKSDTAK